MTREVRLASRRARAARVNAFIVVFGSVGRRFWAAYRPNADRPYGRIEVDDLARPWWLCPYSKRRVYLLNPRYVQDVGGGHARELLLGLTAFVMRGQRLQPLALGPWPTWVCGDGDLHGYGLDNMACVRAAARTLGILAPRADVVHLHVDVDTFTAEWLDEAGLSLRRAERGSLDGVQPVSRGEVCARLAAGAGVEMASGVARPATRALLGDAIGAAGVERLAAAEVRA